MFEFFFKYPRSGICTRPICPVGRMADVDTGAADRGRGRRSRVADPLAHGGSRAASCASWRAWFIWGLQTLLAALVLVLLWQPAITVAELKPQQNIIAVLVDDSRSMAIIRERRHPPGASREGAAERRPGQPQPFLSNASVPRRRRARPHRQPQGPATHRALHPHRRQPQAVERGDFRPAHRRRGAAQRRRRQRRAASARTPSARCALATFPFTPWASDASAPHTTWNWTMPWLLRAPWPTRASPPRSRSINADTRAPRST